MLFRPGTRLGFANLLKRLDRASREVCHTQLGTVIG